MDDQVSFGYWLRRRRKALDLTQEALAAQISCSVTTIRKIEADERRPSRQLTELLAQALQLAPQEWPRFLQVARAEQGVKHLAALAPVAVEPARPATPISVSAQPNLPTSVTALIGRSLELDQIMLLLQDAMCRLLTLVGPGGIGKTRLALAVAEQEARLASAAPRFPDGIWFVTLAAVSAAELLASTIAKTLGLTVSAVSEAKTQLLNHLREKKLLLVLDNFEHLVEGAELVTELLQSAPALKVLVTSRERLMVQGEWIFEVQGLPVPPIEQMEHLAGYSAVTLFVQSARRVRPGFTLSAENQAHVVQICRLVEGMPLGIELAAAWVHLLSCQEIAQEIARTIDFLTVNRRDVPHRHRSLRAAFDHSWQLLTAEEQRVIRQLSVFRGGFDRELAAQVAEATLPLLSALVAKSLVQRTPAAAGQRRFDLHELVRQYADEQLQRAGEAATTRARHAYAFLRFAETAESHLLTKEAPVWMDRLEQVRDNLRAALDWALEPQQDAPTIERMACGLRMMSATATFWLTRGYNQEGLGRFKALLARPEAETLYDGRMAALTWAGYFLWEQGQVREAQAYLQEALQLNQRVGDKKYLALILSAWGQVANTQGDLATAQRYLNQSVVLWRELQIGYWLAEGLSVLGDIALAEHRYEAAEALYRAGMTASADSSDALAHPYILRRLAYLALQRADYTSAITLCHTSLRINQAMVTPQGITACLVALAYIAKAQSQFMRAARLLGAVETRLGSLTAPLYATDHQAYTQIVAALATQGEEANLAHAWAEGRAMRAEQVIRYALTVDESVVAGAP